jgi:hypothetical protein
MVDDTIPGVLYRLSVFEADGRPVPGFPKIYSTMSRFKAAIRAQERSPTAPSGRTWIKEGCARGPWLSLEGPVVAAGGGINDYTGAEDPDWPVAQILDEILQPRKLPPRDKSWLETEGTG